MQVYSSFHSLRQGKSMHETGHCFASGHLGDAVVLQRDTEGGREEHSGPYLFQLHPSLDVPPTAETSLRPAKVNSSEISAPWLCTSLRGDFSLKPLFLVFGARRSWKSHSTPPVWKPWARVTCTLLTKLLIAAARHHWSSHRALTRLVTSLRMALFLAATCRRQKQKRRSVRSLFVILWM